MAAHNSVATCNHGPLIRRQFVRIEQLESQLASIRLERDTLALENEQLAFQLEMLSFGRRSPNGCLDAEPRKPTPAHIHSNSPIGGGAGGPQAHNYELSQQLIDKRVSCLERKYGGRSARDAALTIQRAWRNHRLQRRFATIATQAYNKQQAAGEVVNQQEMDRMGHQETKTNEANNNYQTTSNKIPTNSNSNNNQNNNNNNSDSPVTGVHERIAQCKRFSATSASSDDSSMSLSSSCSGAVLHGAPPPTPTIAVNASQFECVRKRQYRVGLNLFNKTPPERGINFLVANGFIEATPNNEQNLAAATARFLLTRKGLSKQMIGEFISSSQQFNQYVLNFFAREIDIHGLAVDVALRKFQTYFRFPGEAQKIERLVDAFAGRYVECNDNTKLSRDSVFILSFAIIMLNTDLHVPTNSKSRMTQQQWLNNLRGVFGGRDLDQKFLLDIYERVKTNELRTGADHVTQVLKVQQAIVGKEVPNLCLPHRRLVCYCRLYEIRDLSRKERPGQHQREIFLFNDILLVTKLTNKSRGAHSAEYQYRSSIALDGLQVTLFTSPHHHFGIRLSRRVDDRLIVTFNARNELDRARFVEDLKESIAEMDEMEQLRITKSNSLLQLNNHFGVDKLKPNPSGTCLSSAEHQPTVFLSSSQSTTFNQSSSCSSMSSSATTAMANGGVSVPTVAVGHGPVRRCSSGSLDSGLSLSRDNSPNQQSTNANVNTVVVVESK